MRRFWPTAALCVAATGAGGQSKSPEVPGVLLVTVAVAGATSLRVSWQSQAVGFSGPAITEYDVRYRKRTASGWTRFRTRGTGLSTTITGLTTGDIYFIKVRAANSDGWGPYASPLSNHVGHVPQALHAGGVSVSARA